MLIIDLIKVVLEEIYGDWKYSTTGQRVRLIILHGLLLTPLIYVLGFLALCFECGLRSPLWSVDVFWSMFGVLTGAGVIIGLIYAISVKTQEKNKARNERLVEEKKLKDASNLAQRQQYAKEFKGKADSSIQQCLNYLNMCKKNNIQSDYLASTLQKSLWMEFDEVSTRLQRLDDIVSELKIKEGK